MPVRGGEVPCWSCGVDPRRPAVADPAAPTRTRRGRVVAVVLLLALAVAGSVAVLAQGERSGAVRGLAARLGGGGWVQGTIRGATAEFPADPVHEAVPAGRGLPRPGECLMAARGGVRAELLVAEVGDAGTLLDGSAAANEIVDGFAAHGGGTVSSRTPLYLEGAPGVDAVVKQAGRLVRVRVTVAGTTAYLLAVTGPVEAFERFSGSFRRSPAG